MLKDITLGQYFPGNTLVHRLDLRTKIIFIVLYIVALFNAQSWLGYALVVLMMLIGFAFGAVWLIITALWLFMYMSLFTLITNLLYDIPNKKSVRKWGFFGLYGSAIAALPLTALLWTICF